VPDLDPLDCQCESLTDADAEHCQAAAPEALPAVTVSLGPNKGLRLASISRVVFAPIARSMAPPHGGDRIGQSSVPVREITIYHDAGAVHNIGDRHFERSNNFIDHIEATKIFTAPNLI
jgi:hypothetical protein